MDIYIVTAPGLEPLLADEAREIGLKVTATSPGGVHVEGEWAAIALANRSLRGAVRVLARLAEFRAMHMAQLDKRARKLPWGDWLREDMPFRVEATCRRSKIYHHKGAAQRVSRAISETLGTPEQKDATVALKVRIEDDLCTISVDTSGASLHLRGHKQAVNKAPMRETLAALFLRACGFDGRMPVLDPMCGSGTFPIEAAEIAAGLLPGRARSFAFEQLAVPVPAPVAKPAPAVPEGLMFYGSDRDDGAVRMATANAERSGVAGVVQFDRRPVSDIAPPEGPPGLVIVNPPYGGRVGNKKPLYGLYAAFGTVMTERFAGWRVGMVTSDGGLAKASGLKWDAPGPIVDHGGIKIRLWQVQL